jgi:hypothetical protein
MMLGKEGRENVLIMADKGKDIAEEHWLEWKKELIKDRFTRLELEAHRHWIKVRLQERIEAGDLQEQPIEEEPQESTGVSRSDRRRISAPSRDRQPTVEDAYNNENSVAQAETIGEMERSKDDAESPQTH